MITDMNKDIACGGPTVSKVLVILHRFFAAIKWNKFSRDHMKSEAQIATYRKVAQKEMMSAFLM